ncbi:MAG: phage GP46 family protein [Methylovirgula sp.]|nr:phage GP46 family protein [Methylovirgula sp.]
MTDIQTGWNRANGTADWVFLRGNAQEPTSSDVSVGNDLATAAMISLFTDAQADPSDTIPDNTTDRRGWWGGPIGSKIWIYTERGKATPELPGQVQQAAADALQWFVDDGVATSVDTAAAYDASGKLVLNVAIHRGDGSSLALQFSNFWDSL